jgi:hypothetical protein
LIYYSGYCSSSFGKQESFGERCTVELELNMKIKTLHFFINNKQIPHYINNINTTRLVFGISGYNSSSSIKIISLLKLHKKTINNNNINNINSTTYRWKK